MSPVDGVAKSIHFSRPVRGFGGRCRVRTVEDGLREPDGWPVWPIRARRGESDWPAAQSLDYFPLSPDLAVAKGLEYAFFTRCALSMR